MMNEVKIERVRGGFIVSYFDEKWRHVREVFGGRVQMMFAVDELIQHMEANHPQP